MVDYNMAVLRKLIPSLHNKLSISGIGVTIINYNTPHQTLRCIESLRQSSVAPDWIVILDNGSSTNELCSLIINIAPFEKTSIELLSSDKNYGFAEGSNILIERLLTMPECQAIVFINNDAIAKPEMISKLADAINSSSASLACCRIHKLNNPDQIDSLGITIYASLMPADRYSLADPLLGPTAGCAIIKRNCLDALKHLHGYCFDPRFFCYCEDTDLVLRATLLGFETIFINETLCLHEGQASSKKSGSEFITYHGLRNSIWMITKCIPPYLLLKYFPLLLIAHILTILRHTLSWSLPTLLKAYRDALHMMVDMIRDRKIIQASACITIAQLDAIIAPRFYREGYAKYVFKQIFHSQYFRSR
jgi:GT2 family glycosyltransferase